VYVAGAKKTERGLETSGGRILGVTAIGMTLRDAIRAAYAKVERVKIDGAFYRRDIGQRALRAVKEEA